MAVNRSAAYAQTALRFAQALVAGDFDKAHSMLSAGFRAAVDADRLRLNYDQMVGYGDGPPTDVQLVVTMEKWPDRREGDLGWAYVAISGADFSEAVTVTVQDENGSPAIRYMEWGRP